MFQTETDAEVIFVSEKPARKSKRSLLTRRRDLQRDIDQQSQPRKPGKPLTSQGSVAVESPVESVIMKTTVEKSEQGFVKRKKLTKGQAALPEKKHLTVDDWSVAEVKKKPKKKGTKDDVIVIDTDTDGESVEGSGEQKKQKKKKIVTESLNGSSVKNGNDKEVSKKKKKKLETAQTVKEKKKKPVKIKAQNVTLEEEQEELPKKAKKRKHILIVNAEEIEEQVKEKQTTDVKITKKRKSAQIKVTENGVKLGTPERETCEVEEVKVKKKNKKCIAKEDNNILPTPQMKGNNKRSKAASGQKVEKDNKLKKKKDKSTKSENVIIDEEETELKTKGKKVKGRNVSVEVSKVEQKEPKKKRETGNSKGGKEVPLLLNCEEVEVQSSETVAKGKKKKISIKVEPVSFGTGAKKRKIKEEAEDQHGSPLKDVVFLSSKTGNADEVNINQERRQALQMDIDQASQPQETKGLGQWATAQFDSSAQQQKFLRLMGGFKKGSQPAAGSSGGANMALGKDTQQQLQQGLLGEFERAQSRRMDFSNKGSGLGFSAPVNKKFFIDVNACRSVRFDD